MELSSSIVLAQQVDPQQTEATHQHQHHHMQQQHLSHSGPDIVEEDTKVVVSNPAHTTIYDQSYIHLSNPSATSQSNNCYPVKTEGVDRQISLQKNHSPPRSQRSTPTPSPTSSPSSPFHSAPATLIDLSSIVSYSQLLQKKDEVILALKYRSGDHLASQALDLLRAGRERVKRITAAGRAATGKPPVKHIQEQYLAVFSRFSEYCTSQNIPTWPIEPVRVAIWVLAMQEKAPPTPATLRQYITRLEFTCTVTAGLFESEFGPSSPLKASALLRELVNRDLPGQSISRPPRSPSNFKAVQKRGRSPSNFDAQDRSLTPPTKKWQPFENVPNEYVEQYDNYLAPFGTSTAYQAPPLIAHPNHQELWPAHSNHQPARYSTEALHHGHPDHGHPVSPHYHPLPSHHLEHHHTSVNSHPRSHDMMGSTIHLHTSHRPISQYPRSYPSEYVNGHGHSAFPAHHSIVQPTADGRYITETATNPWA